MKRKTFVIGDIHGAYKALVQVLKRADFDYENDMLISLGDVADGWTEVAECFEELFKIKNLIYIRGNHDQWLKDWLKKGLKPDVWTMQGGRNTQDSYLKHPEFKNKHLDFLKNTPFYFLDEENRLFVHGGIDPNLSLEKQDKMYMMWDRTFWNNFLGTSKEVKPYKEIYIGHTSIYSKSKVPILNKNIIFMDTGAGWEGVLSLANIDNKEVFQSDVVADLYPNVIGRG